MSQSGRASDQSAVIAIQFDEDTGSAIPSGGILNVLGGDGIETSGSGNTITISADENGYPITPYVVGPVGEAGYQTVQDGLDAANAAGGGLVYVQPGTYTEDLTLYDQVYLMGPGAIEYFIFSGTTTATGGAVIDGTHTPPTNGNVVISGILFVDASAIFSVSSIKTFLTIHNCSFAVTNGYTFNMPSCTGALYVSDCTALNNYAGSAMDNGGITSSIPTNVFSSVMSGPASSSSNPTALTQIRSRDSRFDHPMTLSGSSTCFFTGSVVNTTAVTTLISTSGSVEAAFTNTVISASNGTCYSHGSSNTLRFFQSIFRQAAGDVITGAGTGTVAVSGCTFQSSNSILSTLTMEGADSLGANQIFTTNTSSALQIEDNTISGAGTTTDVDITLVPQGSGTVNIDYATQDALPVYGASGALEELGPLTNGQVIIGSTGATPVAAALTAGTGITITNGAGSITIDASGETLIDITDLDDTDSPYTVLSTDYYMSCNVSSGVLQIEMPDAPTTGKVYVVKDAGGDAATNNITVTTTGGVVTIDGATTFVMNTDYQAAQFVFNGTSYEVF